MNRQKTTGAHLMTTGQEYTKAIPGASVDTAPFWDKLREHKLELPKCTNCGKISYPPRVICPACMSLDLEWTELSGKGEVHTYTVIYQNGMRGFRDDVPYSVAYVTLDEGPQMMTNIIGIDPEMVRIGMKVEIVFDDVLPDVTLPKFKPV
jgi:uncharacterized OB-fold protein